MVIFKVVWAGTWFTDRGDVEFSGSAMGENVKEVCKKMEQAGCASAPLPGELVWEEPLLVMSYSVQKIMTSPGFGDPDLFTIDDPIPYTVEDLRRDAPLPGKGE